MYAFYIPVSQASHGNAIMSVALEKRPLLFMAWDGED